MDSFTPMMITIYLENGYCKLSDMPFDSILAKLYFQQEINNGTFDGDYYKQLPFLKMSDGIYHTSKPFYEISHISNESFVKTFDLKLFLSLNGDMKGEKTILDKTSQRYKYYINRYEIIHTEKITYYVNGNYSKICDLLKNLNYIGKKVSLGWGKILKIDIISIKEDLSLFINNIPSRHLPNIEKYNTLPNLFKTLMPLTPPYWLNHTNEALVYVDYV